jgi:hypothetical protein
MRGGWICRLVDPLVRVPVLKMALTHEPVKQPLAQPLAGLGFRDRGRQDLGFQAFKRPE